MSCCCRIGAVHALRYAKGSYCWSVCSGVKALYLGDGGQFADHFGVDMVFRATVATGPKQNRLAGPTDEASQVRSNIEDNCPYRLILNGLSLIAEPTRKVCHVTRSLDRGGGVYIAASFSLHYLLTRSARIPTMRRRPGPWAGQASSCSATGRARPITANFWPSISTSFRRGHASSNSTASMEVRMSMRRGAAPI